MITLSEETTDLITILFSDTNQQEIKDTLVDCCDYLTSSGLKEDMDRICFAILKHSFITFFDMFVKEQNQV